MKRKFIGFLLSAAAFTASLTACGSAPQAEAPVFKESVSSIISRIDSIGEVDLTKESLIEKIYLDYNDLNELEAAKVSNYSVLAEARAEIATLYNTKERDCPRMDRTKINIGTYCVNTWTDENLQWVADAGIDFIIGVPYNDNSLALCEKYGIGAFLSYLPAWFGTPDNIGQYESRIPSGSFDSYAENFVDHPSIWALDLGDEPGAFEFPHYGVMINEAENLFPNQMAFLNLHPIDKRVTKLHVDDYYIYIDEYVKNVGTDYISFDYYPIHKERSDNYFGDFSYFLENLNVVAAACRESDKDLWAVMQAGSWLENQYLTLNDLKMQTYSALTHGAKAILWACWQDGWFSSNTNMINGNMERTPVYYEIVKMNSIIEELSPVYMRYTNKETVAISGIDFLEQHPDLDPYNYAKNNDHTLRQDVFKNIEVSDSEKTVIAGYFEKNIGNGSAMMFLNATNWLSLNDEISGNIDQSGVFDPESERVWISFELDGTESRVTAYYPETAYELLPNEDGVYCFEVDNADGVFVTVEY